MKSRREIIDYALQRRNTLAALRRPVRTLTTNDACHADPLLIRSALHHGEPTEDKCPVCSSARMVRLNYVFGEQLGQFSGSVKNTAALIKMQDEFGEFQVRVVEVCPDCRWNHLILSYLLGDGVTRRLPRRETTAEDIYG